MKKADRKGSDKKDKEEKDVEDKKADNSVPMTSLKIEPAAAHIREEAPLALKISYEPKNATNTKLKWSCSDEEVEDLIAVSDDGTLTVKEGGGMHTVTITGKATDGSKLSSKFDLRIYPKIDPNKDMVAITFDDGPNPDTTNPMLDVFEENYAKATFFCLGNRTDQNPEVVKREYDLGMEVGTHTYSHQDLMAISDSAREEEISKGVESIKNAIGVAPTLLRPPYGAYVKPSISKKADYDGRVRAIASKYGLTCVNWWVDTDDWRYKSADKTYEGVMTVKDGQIVLLHDIHEFNVDAVRRFVPDLIAQGYQLVTVTEMFETRQNDLGPDIVHYYTDPTTQSNGETGPAGTDSEAGSVSDTAAQTETTSADTTQTEATSTEMAD